MKRESDFRPVGTFTDHQTDGIAAWMRDQNAYLHMDNAGRAAQCGDEHGELNGS